MANEKIHHYLSFFISSTIWVFTKQSHRFFKTTTTNCCHRKNSWQYFFLETYEIKVKQALDHKDTSLGFFEQRVFVAFKSNTNPVVFIPEGYGANYAANKNYINELSPMLNANQICVEHRYFGESWPDSVNWDYLTAKNAAADHHKLVELLSPFFSGKWVSTGISKGGQTEVYHRTWYPNDVDATVAYVCPLSFNIEDGRHEPLIRKVPGTKAIRKK